MDGAGIRGWLSRTHRGGYVFSKWQPERAVLPNGEECLHQRQIGRAVDPWWFGLSKEMCQESLDQQGIEMDILESRKFTWLMKPR